MSTSSDCQSYKILVFGGINTGKTALVIQFVQGYFLDDAEYSLEDYWRRTAFVDGRRVNFDIGDFRGYEGEDRFSSLLDVPFKKADGFILCYRINERGSFDELEDIREFVLRRRNGSPFPMVLVGTWCDDESARAVRKEEGEELAKSWCCPFFEASSKSNENVEAVFFQIVREIQPTCNDNEKPDNETAKDKCNIM